MHLTVITPTIGRASLRATLDSIAPQLLDGDEHLVIGDGMQPPAAVMCAEYDRAIYATGPTEPRGFGGAQRDLGIFLAHGDYLLFCDDDDTFTPDALATVRAAIAEQPGVPLIFRMEYRTTGMQLWQSPVVAEGNVGTPMIVTPRYDDLPKWADDGPPYTADHRFIKRVTDDNDVAWREEVICIVR